MSHRYFEDKPSSKSEERTQPQMTVDNSFTMKKFQSMEIIYVTFSQITKLPYVECDPETFDDQVYMFTEEEAAKEEPRKLRYVLRDLAVAENAFAYEYTG